MPMKCVVVFLFGAFLCTAQTPPESLKLSRCREHTRQHKPWTSVEELLQCVREGDAVAQATVGINYERGIQGFSQDYETAAKWFRRAAIQGEPFAQYYLASLYKDGRGVPQDDAETFRWGLLAAKQGIAGAQTLVGLMYSLGKSVPQDYVTSAGWLRKAAEQGDGSGQAALGTAYEIGLGVPKDYVLAHMWLNLAGAQGDVPAQRQRDELLTKMTRTQIAEAQRLAREFKPKASNEGTTGR